MRPKKRVLLVNANEVGRRVQGLVLRTKGLWVEEASSVEEASAIGGERFDAVVLVLANARERELASRGWGARVLAILPRGSGAAELQAEVVLPAKCAMVEFVGAVKALTARKRGPKKAVESVRLREFEGVGVS